MENKCFCCNGDYYLKYSLDNYKLMKCNHCRSSFIYPRLSDEEIKSTYTEEYFTDSYYKDYQESGKPYMEKIFQQLNIDGYIRSNTRLLDIGCASGYFLSLVRTKGVKVLGVEMSEHWKKFAKDNYGIDILIGDFTQISLEGKFDVITMFHVFEHIVDIPKAISELDSILKDDGIIVIEVPYINGIGSRLKGRNWRQLNPPNHINFFTKKGFKSLFMRSGFNVFKVSTNSNNSQSIVNSFPWVVRWIIKLFIEIFTLFGMGGNLRIYIKRSNK